MINKKIMERFQSGAFGKIYTESLLNNLEALREETGASEIKQTAPFDEEAKEGEICISVTLSIFVKEATNE